MESSGGCAVASYGLPERPASDSLRWNQAGHKGPGGTPADTLVATLMDAMPPGSYLAISHPSSDMDDQAPVIAKQLNEMVAESVTFRDRAAVTRLFDGLDLVDPGVVRVSAWRPNSELVAKAPGSVWGAAGRKP